jgi:hypothetical protein
MKINICIIISVLFINHLIAQSECDPLIPFADSSFANATASNTLFTDSPDNAVIPGTGWTAIGFPDIITTGWDGNCGFSCPTIESQEIDILRNDFVHDGTTENKNILKGYVPYNANGDVMNNMLGAKKDEGIRCNVKLVPGATYLLRFSQINGRSPRFGQLPNSAHWVVTLDGEPIGNSIYMPVAYYGVEFKWHEALIVFDADYSKTNTEDRLLKIIVKEVPYVTDFIPSWYDDDENSSPPTYSGIMNYMLIDNITLIKEHDCESPEVVTHRDNSSFIPNTNKGYVLSAWVKENNTAQPINYSSSIDISFEGATETYSFTPTGAIIEGWQRIEGVFNIPNGSTDINIALNNNVSPNAAYFDDIRIHNADGNMKSFVYDPETQRLMAELDENNYATIYEYDKEGGLVRVKKETERGIYTIQETRSGNSKINASN